MDLTTALAGLDDHPWATVSHAYGSAEDLPDLLRALAEGDEEAAGEALSELYGSILHQGTVYSASVAAVPYLARIAAAGRRTVDVLCLLGGLAESEDEWQVPEGAVRAAVAARLPLLLPMLADPDETVRLTAAWTVGHTRDGGAAPGALGERWAAEEDPDVAAELLVALGRVDPSVAAEEARALLGEESAVPLRLAALLVCLRNEERWEAVHHTAVLGLLPARELTVDRYSIHHEELLHTVVDTLLERDTEADREAALDLLEAALRDPRPEVRAEALWAADHACQVSRGAPARLLPSLAPLAAQDTAASLLAKLGPLAVEAAPVLLDLAGRPDDAAADQALAALVRIDPGQAAPLLARALERRPRARDAAGDPSAPAFPFDRELFAAVRARLAVDGLGNDETADLVHLLRRWGPRAVSGLPELCAVLPHFPHTASAVAAVVAGGPPEARERAAEALRAAAGSPQVPGSPEAPGSPQVSAPLQVARAHYEVTGEPDLLLAAATERLAAPRERAEAAQAAADLGPAAAGLLPALLAAVSEDPEATAPQLDADIATARAVWQIGGDAEEGVRILASVLDRSAGSRHWSHWPVTAALRAAAALGGAGQDLIPRLEALLGDPGNAAGAARALLDIADPDTVDLGRLAQAALHAVETGADVTGGCEALHALGAAAGDTDLSRYVGDLVERDGRIVTSGLAYEIIREDERLRALLAELR